MLERDEVRRWERMTAAMLRQAETDDPEGFAQIVKVLDDARAQLPLTCHRMRQVGGGLDVPGQTFYSWAQVGKALGVTKSAAVQRFGTVR